MIRNCTICGGAIYPPMYVGDALMPACPGNHTGIGTPGPDGVRVYVDSTAFNLCPLTNSSHEKALVRVVNRYAGSTLEFDMHRDFIQVLCSCGHILSECEIKNK